MSARFELTSSDLISIRHARKALQVSKQADMGDPVSMARAMGRMEAAIEDLLEILTGEETDR